MPPGAYSRQRPGGPCRVLNLTPAFPLRFLRVESPHLGACCSLPGSRGFSHGAFLLLLSRPRNAHSRLSDSAWRTCPWRCLPDHRLPPARCSDITWEMRPSLTTSSQRQPLPPRLSVPAHPLHLSLRHCHSLTLRSHGVYSGPASPCKCKQEEGRDSVYFAHC